MLNNALKYTERGQITISIRYDPEFCMIHCFVEDTGLGMTQIDTQKMFKQFSRADHGSKSKGGTGVGLFICQQIVENLNGFIEVSSKGLG